MKRGCCLEVRTGMAGGSIEMAMEVMLAMSVVLMARQP